MDKDQFYLILSKGILAPSVDNLQPWKFRLNPEKNEIDLFLEKEKLHFFSDTGLFAPYFSAGAVIENIRVAAAYYGYSLLPAYFPDIGNPFFVATLRLKSGSFHNHPHFSILDKRKTNRKFFKPDRKIETLILQQLERMAEEEDFRLIWKRKQEVSEFKRIADIIGDADQLRFEMKRLHQEFISLLRWKKQVAETSDGLDIKLLEAGPGSEGVFRILSSWGRMKILNKIGISSSFNVYAKRQIHSSQAVGFLTAESNQPYDHVRGGEVMQRLWHEMTREGLSVQPMEALPIFLINLQQGNAKDFSNTQLSKMQLLKKEFF